MSVYQFNLIKGRSCLGARRKVAESTAASDLCKRCIYSSLLMPRTKIVVSAAALGSRKRPFHVNVSPSTTSSQVVGKVLEKLQSQDPPLRYQLWATSPERGEPAKPYHCSLRKKKVRGAVFMCMLGARPHAGSECSHFFSLVVCVGGEWPCTHTPGSVKSELYILLQHMAYHGGDCTAH